MFEKTIISSAAIFDYDAFDQTQVSLGSDLWVLMSVCHSLQDYLQIYLMCFWLMRIATQYQRMMSVGQS